MRDLEIRGAGNLLGRDQSGHMEAVGYDLYCKMLNDAVLEQKGETKEEDFETSIEIPIDAYIPPAYVKNEMTKLELYKRISAVWNNEDYEDMLDELVDRFGEPPAEVINLLSVALMKAKAHDAFISAVAYKSGKVYITLAKGAKIRMEMIEQLIVKYLNSIRIVTGDAPGFEVELEKKNAKKFIDDIMQIIEDINELIDREENKKDE